mmetsp:Transcript_15716/g.37332  ORF Transcript_15716/g.37332 Transcript_15716/m.37332 type:complete len:216 (+) Transcript_15716:500-1147(+)
MLDELCTAIGQMRTDLGGEKALQFLHGGVDDVLIALAHPVCVATCDWRAGSKDQLEHRLVLVFVLLATRAHVRIHRQERTSAKAEVVHVEELTIKPEMDVDNWNAFQLVYLPEEWVRGPSLWKNALHDVAGDRGDVLVSDHLLTVAHEEVLHGAILVGLDAGQRLVQQHLATPCLNILLHGLAKSQRLISIQESHLKAVRLVQEPVHGREHHGHG